ncbi:family 43 glycosylhydrolase [Bacteroides sp. 51]|uniref:family 43 glycosylhydrolase n=1 Tax=Bacteroides sp. 51 TaxID=2302938 RepID=UPI0013D65676|nr:family 43 glycosylhydrolase [Bacteroides sp. 51]NDV80927.1 1,4-beta-xylanase [Bacteroides sp. 51]
MKSNYLIIGTLLLIFCSLSGCSPIGKQKTDTSRIIANPLNLNYRFHPDEPSRREAADPVLEYFKGKYYLFASKSGGYWSSPDLIDWTYIPCKTITTIEHYAPAIMVMDDAIYFMSSSDPKIFKSTNPDMDNWEDIGSEFEFQIAGSVDPAFFLDDDGKVYIYWGCSDKDPIIGVEVDPKNKFKVVGEAKVLIEHNPDKYGWEVKGPNNNLNKAGYNEGPCIIKYKGKYYLQYAAPGTEVRVYGDGLYISDNPLGPYTYVESSPFSFKPGGFIGGAGHGHTFKDKYGNYWHVATMKISQRHMFERRLGLFPIYISNDDNLYSHTVFTDYPFMIPDRKVNMEKETGYMNWNMLSHGKPASSSSALLDYKVEYANDEQVETWWAAETGNAGEWWQTDLGKTVEVKALQVNFADHDFTNKAENSYVYYQYKVEASNDGNNWKVIVDQTQNKKDAPHELFVLENPIETRFLRITNTKDLLGKFSLYDFRVFGHGKGGLPREVTNFTIHRNPEDRRMMNFSWTAQENASGYIIRWGVKKDKIKNETMVYDNQCELRFFNRDSEYYFTIDSFNENGVIQGKEIVHIK